MSGAAPLDATHVLLTGSTGFVGQAVLEKLLSAYPGTRISLLVRPRGELTAQSRVDKLLRKPVFRAWRERVGTEAAAAAAERLTVISGDLSDLPALPGDLDVVIHSASTVSFDLPIDEAFDANVGGPVALYEALLAAGGDPHVVHVSTAYVAGLRRGVVEERALDHSVDRREELEQARAARRLAESASRSPARLRRIVAEAEAQHRRAGPVAVSQAAEQARADWVRDYLVKAGRTRAQSLGWTDAYTFTKALGEQAAEDLWGAEHALTVVRPTIIESALRHPYPGWIDGFKVADPLIAAYGRGLLPEFPALADTVLDVIPVDLVVNAILAAAATPAPPGRSRYLHVGSGTTNPLSFGRLYRLVREYFEANPLRDAEGAHIQVPTWSFPHTGSVERALGRRERLVGLGDRAAGRLPATDLTRGWIATLGKARRDLGTLRTFTSLYQPYTQGEVIFDDARTRALHREVPEDRRHEHGFDVAEIDWEHYLQKIHVPNVPGLMRDSRPTQGGAAAESALPRRTDVLAVFDLQRTIAGSTPVEHYLWVQLASRPPAEWPASFATLVRRAPRYLGAERRDRGDFIRTFMRSYEGVVEKDLRAVVAKVVAPSLHGNLRAEALAQVLAHREAGHRTVLVTGEIDVFVEPLSELFDEVVAGRMECDGVGRWTGHLAASPLVGEARAAWLRRYAREHGMDLTASYAYGDSYADRPWLSAVGNPNAVNPDPALYRYAIAQRWATHSWTTTAEGRLAPLVRSIRGARRG